jgi:hypothetical protein
LKFTHVLDFPLPFVRFELIMSTHWQPGQNPSSLHTGDNLTKPPPKSVPKLQMRPPQPALWGRFSCQPAIVSFQVPHGVRRSRVMKWDFRLL